MTRRIPSAIQRAKAASGADRQSLPNQFDGLDFSVHRRRRRDQYDLVTLEFDAADQVPIYVVLNR